MMSELRKVKKEDGIYYEVTSQEIQSVVGQGDAVVYKGEETVVEEVDLLGEGKVLLEGYTEIPCEEFFEDAKLILNEEEIPQRLYNGLEKDRGVLRAYILMRFRTPLESSLPREADSVFSFEVERSSFRADEQVKPEIYEQEGYYFTWEQLGKVGRVFSSKGKVRGYLTDRIEEIEERLEEVPDAKELEVDDEKDELNLIEGEFQGMLCSRSL